MKHLCQKAVISMKIFSNLHFILSCSHLFEKFKMEMIQNTVHVYNIYNIKLYQSSKSTCSKSYLVVAKIANFHAV